MDGAKPNPSCELYAAIGTAKVPLGTWKKHDGVKLARALRAALAQINVAHS
jgi:hypothetical protein